MCFSGLCQTLKRIANRLLLRVFDSLNGLGLLTFVDHHSDQTIKNRFKTRKEASVGLLDPILRKVCHLKKLASDTQSDYAGPNYVQLAF